MMFESAVKLSESGVLTAETTFVFWANAGVGDSEATRARGAKYPASWKRFLNICTPYVRLARIKESANCHSFPSGWEFGWLTRGSFDSANKLTLENFAASPT